MPGIGVPKSESINPPGFIGESVLAGRLRMAAQLETLRRDGMVVDGLVAKLGLQTFKVVEEPADKATEN